MISKDKLIQNLIKANKLPKGDYHCWKRQNVLLFIKANLTEEEIEKIYNGEDLDFVQELIPKKSEQSISLQSFQIDKLKKSSQKVENIKLISNTKIDNLIKRINEEY